MRQERRMIKIDKTQPSVLLAKTGHFSTRSLERTQREMLASIFQNVNFTYSRSHAFTFLRIKSRDQETE